ncbi:MAG: hypothetical protein RI885_1722 [Actinomycetota bacterium]
MKRIFYVNGSVITGDRTAEAVLGYAQALAQSEDSATIDIAVVGDLGETARAQLLIGPASQLMVVSQATVMDEVNDEDAIALIERRIAGLTHPESRPMDLDADDLVDPESSFSA